MRTILAALAAVLVAVLPIGRGGEAQLVNVMWPACTGGGSSTSTPRHVQQVIGSRNAAATPTVSATFSSPVAAGDGVLGFVTYDTGTGEAVSSVKDDKGNSYTVVKNINDTSFNQANATFYGQNLTNGPVTVTVTFSVNQPGSSAQVSLDEFAGIAALDVTAAADQASPGTGANGISSGNATTTVNGDLLYGTTTQATTAGGFPVYSAGTSFTLANNTNGSSSSIGMGSEYQVQANAGAVAATFTQSVNNAALTVLAAVKASVMGGGNIACYQTAPSTTAFYVSPTGSDSNPGTLTQPFQTPGKAASAMRSSTIKTSFFLGGIYNNVATTILTASDNGETFSYYPPAGFNSATLDGAGTTQDIFRLLGAQNVTINGLQFAHFVEHGIVGWSSLSTTINGVNYPTTGTPVSDNIITNNILHDYTDATGNPQAAIHFMGNAPRNTVTNNVVFNGTAAGINLTASFGQGGTTDISNGLVANNVVYHVNQNIQDSGAIYILDQVETSTGVKVQNNFVRDFAGTGFANAIYLDNGVSNVLVSGNVVSGFGGTVGTSVVPLLNNTGANNTWTNNIIDLNNQTSRVMKIGVQGGGIPGNDANLTISHNIILSSYTGAGFIAWDANGGPATPTFGGNLYFNYAGGTVRTDGNAFNDPSPTTGKDPLCTMSGATYKFATNSPIFSAPVNFPALPANWGQPGFWGPPGYVIPTSGQLASSCPTVTAANPTSGQTFQQALAGYSVYQNYVFGTGATGSSPTIPITNATTLGASFNPRDSYGLTNRDGEWQGFAGAFTDTNAFVFTANSLKLLCWQSGGSFAAGNFTCGQIVMKQRLTPGRTPSGQHFVAGDILMKTGNVGGLQPAFWCYQAFTDPVGDELDFFEQPVSTNGVWSTSTWVDGTGITPGGDVSTLFRKSGWDGFKNPLGFDASAAFHHYQFIWTAPNGPGQQGQLWTYVDGTPFAGFTYTYKAATDCEVMIYETLGNQNWGQPMNPSSPWSPAGIEVQSVTYYTAPKRRPANDDRRRARRRAA